MKAPVQHRILFVDDNPILRACLGDYLRFHGFEVHTAVDGKQAFKIMRKHEPDLIIVDPVMRGKKGTKFLKQLTSRSGHLRYPVLVYTADSKMKDFYAGTGVEGFLSKEAPELELVASVKDILARLGRHLTFDEDGAREVEPEKAPQTQEAPTEPAAESQSIRILLVEDDEHAAYSLKRSFEKSGYSVEVAANPGPLINMAVKNPPDVIVVKEVLAGTSGCLVVTDLAKTEETRTTPIVLYDDTNTISDRAAHRLEDLDAPLRIVRNAVPAALQEALETLVKNAG
jgi:DNA-binding response OmpR family regulator